MGLSTNGAALRLSDADNVAVVLRALEPGTELTFGAEHLIATQEIPVGHKLATREIPAGAAILKYGQTMGRATVTIAAGEHVHVHNVEGIRGRGDLAAARSASA
jgi:altronate dehydratase small subunit